MFNNDWDQILGKEIDKPYFQNLLERVDQEYERSTVYPPKEEVFRALRQTSYQSTKVVILGQDPYHGPKQAQGLSFSVSKEVAIPPSLRNIYKELASDLSVPAPEHGSLLSWARQGVLLLNAVLTVRKGEPNSHKGLGWEIFTDSVISRLNEREQPLVFVLWGSYAQKKGAFIDRSRHKVIESSHPSPFAAHKGFFGSRPFSAANDFLMQNGMDPVYWEIPNTPEHGDE